jgi:flavin-dependent dehydrogenase
MEPNFGTPPQPLAYVVDKGAFNRGLAAGAVSTGARLHTYARVQHIAVNGAHVHLRATAAVGRPLSVYASLLVLACGVN